MPDTPVNGVETQTRMRSLRSLLRAYEPGQTPFRRITPAMADELLRWAATLADETILDMRNVGHTSLRWIRANQPITGRVVPEMPTATLTDSTFSAVLKTQGWHIEVFWNNAGGWYTARLISLVDREGSRSYAGGFLVPFDDPIGASGATPQEALANLGEAVLEWA